ncbi:hypothetical protein, partial [Cellulophaga sp. Z1A5H]|uniref:hypothetical protein n=1 Tax=Cellulophaga sp. Z1A5H TaxID=2687291 RepID=UPI00196A3D66
MKIINRLIIALFLNCLFCCGQKTKEKSLDFGSPELIKETIFKLPWGSKLMIITKYPTYCWDELNNDNKVYTDAILNIETDLVKRFSQSNIETNVEYKNLNLIQKVIEKESVLDFSYMKTNITYDKKSILIKKRNNIQVKLLSLKNERGNYLNLYTLKNKDTIDVLNIYSSESIDYYENSDYNKYDST